MYFKYFISVLLITILVISCGDNGKQAAQQMEDEFTAIKLTFDEKRKQLRNREEFLQHNQDLKIAQNNLLQQFADAGNGDEIELIRSKILLNLGETEAALTKIDAILEGGSEIEELVKFEKVRILQIQNKISEALTIFKEISESLPENDEVFETKLNFAFEAESAVDRGNFTQELLKMNNWPQSFKNYRPYLYENLSLNAREQNDFVKAKQILQEGIEELRESGQDQALLSSLKLIEMIGQPARNLPAPTWVNSGSLSLEDLKGQVVVVDFWAPWCGPCRAVIPALVQEYNKKKENGLVVIGFTRLYGSYRDDLKNVGKVPPAEEIKLTKGFVERYQISYPVAIAETEEVFDSYSIRGIPTMIFIDKEGNVADFKIGAGNENYVKNRIDLLLAEES